MHLSNFALKAELAPHVYHDTQPLSFFSFFLEEMILMPVFLSVCVCQIKKNNCLGVLLHELCDILTESETLLAVDLSLDVPKMEEP